MYTPQECPITHEIPVVPVLSDEGITYDFVAIAEYLIQSERPIGVSRSQISLLTCIGSSVESLSLSVEVKEKVVELYVALTLKYPGIKVQGIEAIEGVQPLIIKRKNVLPVLANNGKIYDFCSLASTLLIVEEPDSSITSLTLNRSGFFPEALTDEKKTEIARYYVDLRRAYPLLIISGIWESSCFEEKINEFFFPPHVLDACKMMGLKPKNIRMAQHETALHLAVLNHNVDAARLLIDGGEDINAAYMDTGITPLYIAAERNYLDLIELFKTSSKLQPNLARIDKGVTPLYVAVLHGNKESVSALLAIDGIDIHVERTDDPNATALDAAAIKGHTDLVRTLLHASGASELRLRTAICLADKHGHFDIMNLLLDDYLSRMLHDPDGVCVDLAEDVNFHVILVKHNQALYQRLVNPDLLKLHMSDLRQYAAWINERVFNQVQSGIASPTSTMKRHHPIYTVLSSSLSVTNGAGLMDKKWLKELKKYCTHLTERPLLELSSISEGSSSSFCPEPPIPRRSVSAPMTSSPFK